MIWELFCICLLCLVHMEYEFNWVQHLQLRLLTLFNPDHTAVYMLTAAHGVNFQTVTKLNWSPGSS